jgi:HEAT repeat protein
MGSEAKAAAPALRIALKDASSAVRFSAVAALGGVGGAEVTAALPALIEALEDEEEGYEDQKVSVLRALGRMGPDAKEAIPTLDKLIRAPT